MHAHVFPFTGSVGTEYVAYAPNDMELLTRTVLYLQGSDAGQKYFTI